MNKRRKRGAFNLPAIRRGEIERHALHVGAADTEDFWRWLVAWCWHNDQNGRDPVGALMMAAERMGGSINEPEAEAILERAEAMRQRRSADGLARFLGVMYPQRTTLAITTIGSADISKKIRTTLRKRRSRQRSERRRRSQGARPRSDSLTRTKPWEAEGMSRRTWYRQRGTSPNAAIPPLKSGGTNGTSPNAAILPYAADELVPLERKQGASEEELERRTRDKPLPTSLVLEGGVLLTRRWIAAREKACGCRHNRLLSSDPSQEAAGRNIQIDSRWGALDDAEARQRSAKELRGDRMKRRDFITLLSGVATAAPARARAR